MTTSNFVSAAGANREEPQKVIPETTATANSQTRSANFIDVPTRESERNSFV
jgi:hypothetical protein